MTQDKTRTNVALFYNEIKQVINQTTPTQSNMAEALVQGGRPNTDYNSNVSRWTMTLNFVHTSVV